MILQIVGCSHHNSSVDVRERLAFDNQSVGKFLKDFYSQYPTSEAVLLSTCNRTEFYAASQAGDSCPSTLDMRKLLAEACGLHTNDVDPFLFDHVDIDAIRHLFTVAASLDSMVIGETQILAQVKQAYQLASEINNSIPVTHHVFQSAIRVAKRISNETDVHQNRVSIPSIAIGDFARQIFERLDNKKVLVIGAGEMAEETLKYVQYYGGREIIVVNRTLESAHDLSNRFSGTAVDWVELPNQLVDADLIISTTGAQQPVVTESMFREIEPARRQRPLFVLDLAIPRDFEPRIGRLDNVFLYSIDDLQAQCEHNRKSRKSYWPKAKKIIDQEAELFMNTLVHRSNGPMIARLKQQANSVKDAELRRLMNKLSDIDEQQRDEIATAFHRLTNKLLHPPLESLKEESDSANKNQLFDAIKQLFKLGD